MRAILPYLPLFGVTLMANLGTRRRAWRVLAYGCLGALNAGALAVGLLLLAAPLASRLTQSAPAMTPSRLGLSLTACALMGTALLIAPVRVLLSRYLRVDPRSPVHTTALTFAVYLCGTSLAVLRGAEALVSSTALTGIGPGFLVAGQAVFVLFALTGVGLGIRRNLSQTLRRLGLSGPEAGHLKTIIAIILGFLAFDFAISWLWQTLWPANYQSVMRASERLYVPFTSPLGALLLGVCAGIGEETLFRGALQPRLRIPLTSAVFALGHVQYGLSPAIAEIMVVGLVLGWLRERTSTTACIAVHAVYNFLNMLLMPYWP